MNLLKRLFLFLVVALLATGFSGTLLPNIANAQDEGLKSLRETGKAFRSVAKKVSPSVVFIRVETEEKQQNVGQNPFGNSPNNPFGDEFFRRFFGQPPQQPLDAPQTHDIILQ